MIRVGTSLPLATPLTLWGDGGGPRPLGALVRRDTVVWLHPTLEGPNAERGRQALIAAADALADRGFALLAITTEAPAGAAAARVVRALPCPLVYGAGAQTLWAAEPEWGGFLIVEGGGTVRGAFEGSGSATALVAFVDAMDLAADAEEADGPSPT